MDPIQEYGPSCQSPDTGIVTTPEAHEFVDAIFGSFRQMGQSLLGRVRQSLGPADE